MIIEKAEKVVGKVRFEKGRLSLTFPKTHVEQMNIQEQLDTFQDTGCIEFVNANFTFSMKKEGEMYALSLTHPVTKTHVISPTDAAKIEDMLKEVSERCVESSLPDAHSSTNLLIGNQ